MPFDAVIFDLDGTLIDSVTDVANAVNRVLRDAGLKSIEGELQKELLGEGARARVKKAFEMHGRHLSDDELKARSDDFARYYSENPVQFTQPFDGAKALLDKLAAAGMALGVCTNKDEGSARTILTKLELMPPISDVAGFHTFGMQKPHPDHVLKLLHRMNVDPACALFVGDSIHDVEAAKRAGVVVAAVTWGYSAIPVTSLGADLVLQKFSDILKITAAQFQKPRERHD